MGGHLGPGPRVPGRRGARARAIEPVAPGAAQGTADAASTAATPAALTAAPSSATRAWARSAEQASLNPPAADLTAALRAFKALRDPALQMRLAREAARTRAAELTLAYRNVVMVCAGYKRKRTRNGQERRQPLPCIVFVVRQKWPPGSRGPTDAQHLPAGLLTYADIEGQRVLVAIPTDVQDASAYAGARSEARRAVYLATEERTFGTLTCVVAQQGGGAGGQARRWAMAPLHVLSPWPELQADGPTPGAEASRLAAGVPPALPPTVGRGTSRGGRLRDDGGLSFDVQLAEIPGAAALAAVRDQLADMPLSPQRPWLKQIEDFEALPPGQTFTLLLPDNHPDFHFKPRATALARFEGFMPTAFSIEYEVRRAGQPGHARIHHFELLKFALLKKPGTRGGDSGSPVVLFDDQGLCTLVGMHIAGDGDFSYAIPAWQLFDLDNWWQPPAGRLKPVDP